uniref:F-box domain-containing protein n=2 Tax=Chrysotila carterae TaxID=13221 RepID=A0A7S4B5Q2_CHRCT|mmetsp:Transcript_26655/g.56017  ORF Transcript_26655/g.56017 Transcript_26655/m.56017 type:complete len:380 (+) Transcript_26655:89-1228(+)
MIAIAITDMAMESSKWHALLRQRLASSTAFTTKSCRSHVCTVSCQCQDLQQQHSTCSCSTVSLVLSNADLLEHILSHLRSAKDVTIAASVSSLWHLAANSTKIWLALCELNWPGSMLDELCCPREFCKRKLRAPRLWNTLEHSGIMFSAAYCPHGCPLLYDGLPIYLTPEQEEPATIYVRRIMQTKTLLSEPASRRFWHDWRLLLQKRVETQRVTNMELCDFSLIRRHLEEQRQMPAPEARRAESVEAAPFKTALIDGERVEVSNYLVTSPGIVQGGCAGHWLAGRIRRRIVPEDVILNLSHGAAIPRVPDLGDGQRHAWRAVAHDHTQVWIAKWRDPVCGSWRYVRAELETAYMRRRFWLATTCVHLGTEAGQHPCPP